MEIVNSGIIKDKKVLLRLDIDVPLRQAQGKPIVVEDFRLRAGLPTVKLCLENASEVIAIGHIGRPSFADPKFAVAPIIKWFESKGLKLKLLENLRFDPREVGCSMEYAQELASMGEVYVNEAFAAHHPAASTTVLPTLLPHFAGLRFAKEVEKLTKVRNNPQKPFVAILGGAKIEDKLPVIEVLAMSADAVLVGGKLVAELSAISYQLSANVFAGKLNIERTDIAPETVLSWKNLIMNAKMIVWNGPVGKFEDPQNNTTEKIARMVLDSGAEIIIGGGDTIAALGQYSLLEEAEQKVFVSTGGGAMLKFLVNGTLPTIEALE